MAGISGNCFLKEDMTSLIMEVLTEEDVGAEIAKNRQATLS